MDIAAFKKDSLNLSHEDVVQKYLLDGSCFFFDKIEKTNEFQFKKDLANSLDVHIRDIAIVGSAKLGFSIKPDKGTEGLYSFKEFDFDYSKDTNKKKSDLDIAIVSNTLFDNQLKMIYEYTGSYSNLDLFSKKGGRNEFAKYILKGWIRPDLVPDNYKISEAIKDIQDKYKTLFKRDVNIGIYKNWYYFENYHIENIRKIYLNLIAT
ncbi:hypothetical protein [Flammeovirga sp. SJP92]|uniref:hypothetical protein n=1 Tax=Flammeovirga sp. SJP92 TaxID=1775430 RepID=UPI0007877428|nr:hypothetical protein [Flammeovirga sp. SJP92]KXX69665.1 hypothetical protein AVL50_15500 [Flammeovirga sp. SJP92]